MTPHEGSADQGSGCARVPSAAEDSPSGLGRTIGNRVGLTPSGVQIPYPPPTSLTIAFTRTCLWPVPAAGLEPRCWVAQYEDLPDVYEWLIPDAKLTPEGSAAALGDLVEALPPNARVLDCSCGTGQLAVGLRLRGLEVVATDASAAMIRRTEQLADEHGVVLQSLTTAWAELLDHLAPSSFDLVLCVGNSLGHAAGASGRLAALGAMARLLEPGGQLVLASRTWELVRARGTRVDVWDRLVNRRGLDAVVAYWWQIEEHWEDEHHVEIAVAQVGRDGSVRTTTERLSVWPYRYEELVAELGQVGLRVVESDFAVDAEGYRLVARLT
jgi:SAM-dependent methyltransferase